MLGVVGQRGSGNRTCSGCSAGCTRPAGGRFCSRAGELSAGSRAAWQARQWGIEAVYQNPPLANNLTVLQNIFLGRELCHFEPLRWWPKEGEMAQSCARLLRRFRHAAGHHPRLARQSLNEQRQAGRAGSCAVQSVQTAPAG